MAHDLIGNGFGAAVDRFNDSLASQRICVQQAQGHVSAADGGWQCRQPGLKLARSIFDVRGIGDGTRLGLQAPIDQVSENASELFKAIARGCGSERHGHSQLALKRFAIDLYAAAIGLIYEVHAYDHSGGQLKDLKDEIEVALQAPGFNYHDDGIRALLAEEVARYGLIFRTR